ncbi:UDP-3-O-(3-hydroxymyristoyl)glucosamine N-acyltransferase [Seongchinamella sediminis]|uniref:UDP-3-O-acylglucosamine N-acyltransferase n=1 Tax=Seongchinamella sediminis TaxID=2283635 RepID=A0A3L7E2T6_9GAMM|nr:UDP-3-O-(3-hydroxymyristoyl)glucosamine N-acyltransferase [Seongchinamella sediminis]RLQ23886.1 UDP-3-O-(3-hydroxymyristoyl)glucosamine N-acyltransferase [Seongchinamella sediminis]
MTLGELAQQFDLQLAGDPRHPVAGLATLAGAGPDQVSFLANRKYADQLAATRAAAVVIQPELVDQCPVATLATPDPYLAFARLSAIFDRAHTGAAGIHPTATVSAEARIAESATVAANAVIEAGVEIAEGASIGANCYVGEHSQVGANSRLNPGVVIYHDVRLGEACIIHSQAVLGADGFGFAPAEDGWVKIHQLGGVRIGDRVEIGACTTIDRGALEHTVIEDGVIIDNQVHIGHNCRIGKNTAIAGCTGMAGSTIIGADCTLAGGVGLVGHIEICDGVHVTGMTMVTRSIKEPGVYSSGVPMATNRDWRRNAVRFSQLESIHKRLVALEKGGEA